MLYTEKAETMINDFNRIHVVLLSVCLALIVLAFATLLHPLTLLLGRTVKQTNATMLLLPPQVLRCAPEANMWIEETLSKE